MKQLFPGRIHISILPYKSLLPLLFLSLFLLFPKPSLAACTPGACSGTGSPCTVSPGSSGTTTRYCCTGSNSAAECTALKSANGSSNSANNSVGAGANNTTAATDPTAGCSDTQINTALGCISVETKGFTASLLKFLAGVAGAISLVIMLVATIQIMTGGDNAEQVKKGKELFTGAVTGLLFIVFSVALLRIIAGDIIKLEGF